MDTSLIQHLEALRATATEMIKKCDQLEASITGRKVASKPSATAPAPRANPQGRRELSANARKRISMAQKRRWAEHRKREAAKAQSKPAVKKAGSA